MSKIAIRDVSPFLKVLRNFLLGRKHILALRFEDELATRSPPLPNLPEGPSHLLNTNYYCNRDARREVAPPLLLKAQKQISGKGGAKLLARTPGKPFKWD